MQQFSARQDAVQDERTFSIVANSGEVMESGERQELSELSVVMKDGTLKLVSELPKASKSGEPNGDYFVPVMVQHSESAAEQAGGAFVWLDEQGLRARVRFSENELGKSMAALGRDGFLSFSIATDNMAIDEEGVRRNGILREISVVMTGNDPRTKITKDERKSMSDVKKDALTVDEAEALLAKITDLVAEATEAPEADEEEKQEAEKVVEATDEADAPAEETAEDAAEEAVVEEANKEEKEEEMAEAKDAKNGATFITVSAAPKQVATDAKWLKSSDALETFGRTLVEARDSKEFKSLWAQELKAHDSIDLGDEIEQLPQVVIDAIERTVESNGEVWNLVNRTGMISETVAVESSATGALGRKATGNKTEQEVEVDTQTFNVGELYKLQKLSHLMVRQNGGLGSSAIVRYILNELPARVLAAAEQAILVGGVMNDDTPQTEFSALKPAIDYIEADGIYGSEYTPVADDNARATLSKAANLVKSGFNRVYVTTPDTLTDLENAVTDGGQLLFPNGINKENPQINGISRIVTPQWLTAEMLGDYTGFIMDATAYHVVGDTTTEAFADYNIDTNQYAWESVLCIGGGIAKPKAIVGIKGNVSA